MLALRGRIPYSVGVSITDAPAHAANSAPVSVVGFEKSGVAMPRDLQHRHGRSKRAEYDAYSMRMMMFGRSTCGHPDSGQRAGSSF